MSPNKGVFILKTGSGLLLIGICGFCIIFYAITMLPQDRMFSEYKKTFKEIQHPARTEFIKDYNFFGVLDETRIMYKDDFPQGCDYRVAEVREYSDTQESIKVFYANKKIIVNRQETSIGIIFIPTDSAGLIDTYRLTHDEIIEGGPAAFDILASLRDNQDLGFLKLEPMISYYFVSSGGFSLSNLDFRCQF